MNFETLIVEKGEDFVAEIVLNRPKRFNTFNTPLAAELGEALKALDADREVRVIMIKGAGKTFCAGIDVTELEGKSPTEYREWIERMEEPLVAISRMKKPVIAKVHGVAAANGMGLVASADLCVAADSARFGLT
ncbi:MAG TPA: enoyl-CoA hydratase/isomerase family protein, partial [Geobacteraceae bacterium]